MNGITLPGLVKKKIDYTCIRIRIIWWYSTIKIWEIYPPGFYYYICNWGSVSNRDQ